VTQQESTAGAARPPAPVALDPVRLEQFLDLGRDLLLGADPDALPERLAQGIALFLGVCGAAVGLVENGSYGVVATHGVGADYARRYADGARRNPALGRLLAAGRPGVLREADGARSVVLPFRVPDLSGALHLVVASEAPVTDADLQLARVLALLAGAALANAHQQRRLAELARLRSDALTAMAHDLRAPLNALIGYASLLGEGAFGPLSGDSAGLGHARAPGGRAGGLLGATLDVARLETGRLPVRVDEFALADLLAALLEGTFACASREGRLACHLAPGLPPMRTDRVKVKEIVQNLVDNALKHGAGAVALEVALATDGETVRITVRDAGPGIPADVLPHLFEPFRPANGKGTGFGLYIVRCFAEALGGRVAARSSAGEGAAITVELPLRAPAR
jgi:signal transduction histidine kinase